MKTSIVKLIVLFVTAPLLMVSCKKDKNLKQDIVYVAWNKNAGHGITVASFSKNSEKTSLSNATQYSTANDIFVSNDDVYIAGADYNGIGMAASYWKNGNIQFLTDGEFDASLNSITTQNYDVYAVGYQKNENEKEVATFWLNGVANKLAGSTNNSEAYDIKVSGNLTFIAGFKNNGTKDIATVWQNGISGTYFSANNQVANAVDYVAPNIYVAGTEEIGSYHRAKYWINNEEHYLGAPNKNTFATSIYVANGNVYVTGYEDEIGSKSVAKYWINGTEYSLSDGSENAVAKKIRVFKDDIYIVGYEGEGGINKAKYWKNGNGVIVSNDGSSANAIFIQP